VVLHAEQVVAEPVGEDRRLNHTVRIARVRHEEVAELELAAVVGHRL
jgi:hypothetical protein